MPATTWSGAPSAYATALVGNLGEDQGVERRDLASIRRADRACGARVDAERNSAALSSSRVISIRAMIAFAPKSKVKQTRETLRTPTVSQVEVVV